MEFFLVTSTALVISAVWFGPISHTWNFLANPVGWLAAGIAIFLIEFVLFWIGIILESFYADRDHQDLQAGSGCGAEPR